MTRLLLNVTSFFFVTDWGWLYRNEDAK